MSYFIDLFKFLGRYFLQASFLQKKHSDVPKLLKIVSINDTWKVIWLFEKFSSIKAIIGEIRP